MAASPATREERSAGFVVFRRNAAIGGEAEFLLLQYKEDGYWGLSKGHVEEGEGAMDAARRELSEETGISRISVVPAFAEQIDYFFRAKDGARVHKTVAFFLAELANVAEGAVRLSDEHVAFGWLCAQDALARLTYDTDRPVVARAICRLASERAP